MSSDWFMVDSAECATPTTTSASSAARGAANDRGDVDEYVLIDNDGNVTSMVVPGGSEGAAPPSTPADTADTAASAVARNAAWILSYFSGGTSTSTPAAADAAAAAPTTTKRSSSSKTPAAAAGKKSASTARTPPPAPVFRAHSVQDDRVLKSILQRRRRRNVTHYLVQWERHIAPTWESADHLGILGYEVEVDTFEETVRRKMQLKAGGCQI